MCRTTHLKMTIGLLQLMTTSFHWAHKAPQFSVTQDLQHKSICSSYQESYLHLQSTGIHRKYNSLPITQTGLFQTPPHNAHVPLVFTKQHTTQATLQKPCMISDLYKPETIQMFGVDQQLKRTGLNIMNTSYVLWMTSLPSAIR